MMRWEKWEREHLTEPRLELNMTDTEILDWMGEYGRGLYELDGKWICEYGFCSTDSGRTPRDAMAAAAAFWQEMNA